MSQPALDAALVKIARAFASEEIVWGVGGSRLLLAHGIASAARDLDLLVTESTAGRAKELLQTIGRGEAGLPKPPFCSHMFMQFTVDSTETDLIAGYSISHEAGVYEQQFSAESVTGSLVLGDAQIPLTALEDWYVTYQLYPAKAQKAEQIEAYFTKNGVAHPELLRLALQGELPERVRVRIERLLVQLS
ncbi:hypothetical protein CBW65_17135 [Tumebacillus avium]|uniref:Nucleotidyl transferase AbiEii/AbiGii toxin family protein n=1 Tax=Tumebacillus avium TaxID=1903704 RepID=A0A1Y0IPH5_9BACL|nr:hypothetical protein [Tumebacillus avium]ARU62492.1 hypothetical protein CBW65_17135 [Tumebacillus avium]